MVVWVWHTTVASYNCVLPRHCAQPRTGSLRRLATHATTAQRPAKTRFVLAAAPSRLSQHPKPPVGPAKPDTRSSHQPCRRAAAPRLASFQRATLKLHPQSAPSTQPRRAKHRHTPGHSHQSQTTATQAHRQGKCTRCRGPRITLSPPPLLLARARVSPAWPCGSGGAVHMCACVCVCVCVCARTRMPECVHGGAAARGPSTPHGAPAVPPITAPLQRRSPVPWRCACVHVCVCACVRVCVHARVRE